jgi:hypothetical protein
MYNRFFFLVSRQRPLWHLKQRDAPVGEGCARGGLITSFNIYVGLFCLYVGLFCLYVGLFCLCTRVCVWNGGAYYLIQYIYIPCSKFYIEN